MISNNEVAILKDSNEIIVSKSNEKVHVRIEHQLMQILALLMEFENKIVEKKTFIDRIWEGNSLVGDAALTKNIFKLREIFKKNGIDHIIQIETIPKKGYRLLMNQKDNPVTKKPVSYSKRMLIIAAMAVLVFCIFFIYRQKEYNTHPIIRIIGKDTVIQLSNKKPKLISTDTSSVKIISLDSAKN